MWTLNVGGLFGCHFLYFLAVRNAPVVEVSLIAYLWPLFIVLFSALAPGEKLRWYHLVGAVLGFGGTFLVITKGQSSSLVNGLQLGHLLAVPTPSYGQVFRCSFENMVMFLPILLRAFAWPVLPSQVFAILSWSLHFGLYRSGNGLPSLRLADFRWVWHFMLGTLA